MTPLLGMSDPSASGDHRRFVVAAGAARVTTEGGPVALVLAGAVAGTSPSFVAALLATWTLPQIVVGPIIGALVDRSRAPRRWCAVSPAVAGVGLVALVESLRWAAPVSFGLALVQAFTQPVVNGGISAVASAAPEARLDRWDALSYNVAGVGGPAAVALFGSLVGARVAAVAVAVSAFLAAAALPASLPAPTVERPASGARLGAGIGRAVAVMLRQPVLRVTTVVSTLAMVGIGGLSLAAVSAVEAAGRRPAVAAQLLTVLAVAALAGSWIWTRRPDIARPDVTAIVCVVVTGLALGAASWTSALPLHVVCFAVAGLADAPLLLATLAARSRHSPPGDRAAVFTIGASAKIAASAIGAIAVGAVATDGESTEALRLVAALHLVAAAFGVLVARVRRG